MIRAFAPLVLLLLSPAPPFVVITRTGMEIQAQGPPRVEGGMVSFVTWPGGTPLRMRLENLDLPATEERNGGRLGLPVAKPAAAPATATANRKITNKDLEAFHKSPEAWFGSGPPPETPGSLEMAAPARASGAAPAPAGDPEIWAARMQELKAQEAALEARRRELQSQSSGWGNLMLQTDNTNNNAMARQYNRAMDELERVEKQLAGTRAAIENARNEARKSGAPAGVWR